jgi:predicted phosphodiesterase
VSKLIADLAKVGPEWPVVQPGPVVRMPSVKAKASKQPSDYQTCVVLPDMQIGYFRNSSGELEPTHDEYAIDLAFALTKQLDPDLIVMVGDNLDLPEFGKYRLSSAYALTTQASIDRATLLCAQLRTHAPRAKIVWLAGNHEERLVNFVIDNAKAAFGIRRGNTPGGWPILSIPYLCRFDDYDVEYIPGYPAGQYWINQRLRVIHGTKVRSNGSTAHAYLNTEKTSVIYGHIHRREWAERSREDYDGPKTIMAVSPGTLARCDGSVPSTKGSIDLDGRPMTIVEDWQQGIGVVTYQPGEGSFFYEQVPFHDGSAFFRGKFYHAKKEES